jgi:hypothetical protein
MDLHRRGVILQRRMLTLLALMELPIPLLCFALYKFVG